MAGHDIIVIGASAGGVEALSLMVGGLPADLPAAVFVVLHLPSYGVSVLPGILSRRGPLPAHHPADGEIIRNGRVYIAPPDYHLLIEDGHIRLSRGPSENGHRPAVDTLFRTAARAAGPRVIGVILSGALDDGTAGLLAVKSHGGLAVVQDPQEALFSSMPQSAVDHVAVDHVLPLSQIALALPLLAREPVPSEGERPVQTRLRVEADVAGMDRAALEAPRSGEPTGFTCPECHGALWEVRDGELTRFRCRVGHAYSSDSLLAAQTQGLEDALWIAMRALEENAAMADRMAERAHQRGHSVAAGHFDSQAGDARQRAAIVRRALLHEQASAAEAPIAQARTTEDAL